MEFYCKLFSITYNFKLKNVSWTFPFIINWTYMLVGFYSGEYTIINSINYLFSFFIVLLTFLLETPLHLQFCPYHDLMFLIISKLAGMRQWCCLINVLIVEWKIERAEARERLPRRYQGLEKDGLREVRVS